MLEAREHPNLCEVILRLKTASIGQFQVTCLQCPPKIIRN